MGYSSGDSVHLAKKLGLLDQVAQSAEQIFEQSDTIILATPLLAMQGIIAHSRKPVSTQLIIDCGSVKGSIIATARHHWQEAVANFVPCHPIAGSEHSGPMATNAELYKNARVIMTPLVENSQQKIDQARLFWQHLGAQTFLMQAEKHDQLLSISSHLPHILSFALVEGLYRRYGDECFQWSAGGFKDFSRIASSNAEMWRDISLLNNEQIVIPSRT